MTAAFRRSYAIAVAMIAAAFLSIVLTPRADENAAIPDFEAMIPKEFGEWKMLDMPIAQARLTPEESADQNIPYDRSLMRTYVNASGEIVMLAIGYVRDQRQERKVHRPELCYYAQGYSVRDLGWTASLVGSRHMAIRKLVGLHHARTDLASYWIRVGPYFPKSAWEMRWVMISRGLLGESVDGLLVRLSGVLHHPSLLSDVFSTQDQFIRELLFAVPEETRQLLQG